LKDLVYGLKKLYNLWEKNKKEYYLNSSKNREIILQRFSKTLSLFYFKHFINQTENIIEFLDSNLLNYYNNIYNNILKEGENYESFNNR